MSLPLNFFLYPEETKDAIDNIRNRYSNKFLYENKELPYTKELIDKYGKNKNKIVDEGLPFLFSNVSKYCENMLTNATKIIPYTVNKVIQYSDAVLDAGSKIGTSLKNESVEIVKNIAEGAINIVSDAVNVPSNISSLQANNENEPETQTKKSFPTVQTPYIQRGKLHRIGAGGKRRKSKSPKSRKRSRKHRY